MNTALIIALAIPWIFWGVVMGMLIFAGRSWINMLLMPMAITVLILIVSRAVTSSIAFWISFILHLFLLIFFLVSFVSYLIRQRNK